MHSHQLPAAVFALLALFPIAARADEKPGKLTFPTSCEAGVQAEFETGVAMLHLYAFGAAGKIFQAVLQKDPKCAMAYWGIALDLAGDMLAGPPSPRDAQAARAALEKARALGATASAGGKAGGTTPRERDWIAALGTYYQDSEKVPVAARLDAYDAAMEELTKKYPDDFEAQIFRALSLQASAAKNDVGYSSQLKSAAILEQLFEQFPRHPGVAHYLYLAYSAPPLADKGLVAAGRYAGIAAAAPNARHAPSRIYTTLGLWEESIAADTAALELQPDYFQAYDSSMYAALQRAQDTKAKTLLDKATGVPPRGDRPLTVDGACALAAMSARYAMERLDWTAAAALPVKASPYPQADSLTRFARGLGMALSGNSAGARREVEALNALRATLQKTDQAYWADRTEEEALTVSAWAALAEGNRTEALKQMQAAADSEDGHIGNPAMEIRLYPMRELLAEMLVAFVQPGPALQEFETALELYPNRYRALWGAILTSAATGQREKAFGYIERFIALTKEAEPLRPEIVKARAFAGKK